MKLIETKRNDSYSRDSRGTSSSSELWAVWQSSVLKGHRSGRSHRRRWNAKFAKTHFADIAIQLEGGPFSAPELPDILQYFIFPSYYYILLWYLRLAIKRAWVAWGSTNACIRLAPCDKIRDVKYMHCTALQNHTYQNSAALRGICRHWLRRRVLQDHCTRTSRLGGSVGESSSQRPGSACEGPSLIRFNNAY